MFPASLGSGALPRVQCPGTERRPLRASGGGPLSYAPVCWGVGVGEVGLPRQQPGLDRMFQGVATPWAWPGAFSSPSPPSSPPLPVQLPGTWRGACPHLPAGGPWESWPGSQPLSGAPGEAALGQGGGLEVPSRSTWDWICTDDLRLDAQDPTVPPAPHHCHPHVLAPPLVSRDSGLDHQGSQRPGS